MAAGFGMVCYFSASRSWGHSGGLSCLRQRKFVVRVRRMSKKHAGLGNYE